MELKKHLRSHDGVDSLEHWPYQSTASERPQCAVVVEAAKGATILLHHPAENAKEACGCCNGLNDE